MVVTRNVGHFDGGRLSLFKLARQFILFILLSLLAEVFLVALGIHLIMGYGSYVESGSWNFGLEIFGITTFFGLALAFWLFLPLLFIGALVWVPVMWIGQNRGFSLRFSAALASLPCAILGSLLLPLLANWEWLSIEAVAKGRIFGDGKLVALLASIGMVVGPLVALRVFRT